MFMDPESLDDRLQRQHVSEKALGQFESETGIRVKHLPAPETSQGQLRLIRELLGERDTPDVLGVDVVWTGLLDDALLDLKPFFSSELSAAAEPDLVSSYAVKSRVVAVPYHPHVNVLYVISNGGDQPNVVPQGASVLLPGDLLSAHQGAVGDRRPNGYRGCHDDRYEVGFYADRYSVARILQQAYRGRGYRECEAHRASGLV
jgi:hypothetical protein